MILSPHEIAYVALSTWPNDASATVAVAVALAESGGDTDALGRSKTGAHIGNRVHGLWQISGKWQGAKLKATPAWRDPWVNARMAERVWAEAKGTFKPWSVFTSESYLTYMPDAALAVAAPFPPPVDPMDSARLIEVMDRWVLGAAVNTQALAEIRKHFT